MNPRCTNRPCASIYHVLCAWLLVLLVGGPALADDGTKKDDETFVDEDGDGIQDGKEHRFRLKKRRSSNDDRHTSRRKGRDGGGNNRQSGN